MAKHSILDKDAYDLLTHNSFLSYNYKWNLDKTKFIVAYEGEQPSCINGYQEYNDEEINNIITNFENNWLEEDPTYPPK